MTVTTIHQIPHSGVTASPSRPADGAVATAFRALATAVDLEVVSEARFPDGAVLVEVSTIGLPRRIADRLWSELLAGMVVEEQPTPWVVGGLFCREVTGLLLALRVRVVATGPVDRVAA